MTRLVLNHTMFVSARGLNAALALIQLFMLGVLLCYLPSRKRQSLIRTEKYLKVIRTSEEFPYFILFFLFSSSAETRTLPHTRGHTEALEVGVGSC